MIVQLFVYLQCRLWQAEANLRKKYANYAPKFVHGRRGGWPVCPDQIDLRLVGPCPVRAHMGGTGKSIIGQQPLKRTTNDRFDKATTRVGPLSQDAIHDLLRADALDRGQLALNEPQPEFEVRIRHRVSTSGP